MAFYTLIKGVVASCALVTIFSANLVHVVAAMPFGIDEPAVDVAHEWLGFRRRGSPPPGERASGGTRRQGCPEVGRQSVIALVPEQTYGETIAEQPTLWFYVPYEADQIARGVFSLQTEGGDNISAPIAFTLPSDAPGFVSITLPEAFALESANKNYEWFFELYCMPDGGPISVNGWIQNIERPPELESELTQEDIPDDVVFAEHLIWFDAVNSLAELRSADPESPELIERWNELMANEAVLLEDLPEAPFVGEVVLKTPELIE